MIARLENDNYNVYKGNDLLIGSIKNTVEF